MKQNIRTSGSILLAFLLLFSTLSFTLDMHFCGKSLVDFGLYQDAEGCDMSMDEGLMTEMGCCNDLEIFVQGQDDLDQHSQGDTIPAAVFISFLTRTFQFQAEQDLTDYFVPHRQYIPPLLIRDLSIRDQVFLI